MHFAMSILRNKRVKIKLAFKSHFTCYVTDSERSANIVVYRNMKMFPPPCISFCLQMVRDSNAEYYGR